ncbi:hypothetical protein ACXN5S_06670 [Pseudoroseicyclus sp. H15]
MFHPYPAQQTDLTFLVIAADGTHHRLVIRYSAQVSKSEWQTGESAEISFSRFDLKDDRQCHYELMFEHRRSIAASVNAVTGVTSELSSDFVSGRVGPPNQMSGLDLGDWVIATVFGMFSDLGRAGTEVGRVWEALDWNVDRIEDVFSLPGQAVALASAFTVSGIELFGRSMGRAVGLRTGINCGEARPLIDANVRLAQAGFHSSAKALGYYDFFTEMWARTSEDWRYVNRVTGWGVPAYLVIPLDIPEGYEEVAEIWPQALAERLYPGAPEAVGADVAALGADVTPMDVAGAVLPAALAAYESELTAARTDLPDAITDMLTFIVTEDELSRRINSFTHTFERPASPAAILLGVDPELTEVEIPSCIVVADGLPGRFVASMYRDGVDPDAIPERARYGQIVERLSALEAAGRQLESAHRAFFPAESAPNVLDEAAEFVLGQGERMTFVAGFLAAKARCESTVILPGRNDEPVLLDGLEWEQIRDILVLSDGVTDPLPDDLFRGIDQLDPGNIRVIEEVDPGMLDAALNELQQMSR